MSIRVGFVPRNPNNLCLSDRPGLVFEILGSVAAFWLPVYLSIWHKGGLFQLEIACCVKFAGPE